MTTENIHAACVALAQSMLSPEQFGYAVTAEVRDEARKALGRAPVEQAQYLNAAVLPDRHLDFHIDAVLRAAGSGLRHYSMQKTLDDMRTAMRTALLSAVPADHVRGVTEMVDEVKPVAAAGWVLVPKEPTDAMQAAGPAVIRFDTTIINKMWTANAVYRAMIAAAPQQPAPAVGADAVRNAALEEAAILFDEMHAVTGTQHNYFAFGAGRIRALQAGEQS